MREERVENNKVYLEGEMASAFIYSHEMFGEKFYRTDILICRTSGCMDAVPLMVSEKLIDAEKDYSGCTIEVIGQFRSYNRHETTGRKLVLSVFVQEIRFIEEEIRNCSSNNQISLEGYICKAPVYRKTPKGREIADILLAVNRSYGKSDYIPCIVWGRNAVLATRLEVGSLVKVLGRIQSREYMKQLSEAETEVRVAYEVSVSTMEAENEAINRRKA